MHLSLTSVLPAVLLLVAHLTLVMATSANPDHLNQCPLADSNCILDLAPTIIEHLDEKTARHFHMTCSAINEACKPSRPSRVKKSFVGDNPSFLQSVRRCMHWDDVICFTYVKRYFEEVKKVEPHQLALVLAQLPHLAAKLNAPNIFKALNISKSTQQYRQVLIRAYLQRREKFFSQIGDIKPHHALQRPVVQTYNNGLYFLEKEDADVVFYVNSDRLSGRYQHKRDPYELWEFWVYHRQNRNEHPEDFFFVTAQDESCPSITDILDALDTQDLEERRTKIAELKTTIDNVLRQGVYIMDDIVLNIGNTVYLWWKYAQPLKSSLSQKKQREINDGGASEFVYWLIDQGAPMDETHLLNTYASPWFESYDEDRFRELVRVWTLYDSRGPTKSLIGVLRFTLTKRTQSACPKIRKSLPQYKANGADMFDTRVLWLVGFWLTDYRGTEDCHRDIMVWYAKHGLKEDTLNVLQGPIPTWLPSDKLGNDEERLESAVVQWKIEIKKKKDGFLSRLLNFI